MLEGWVVQSVAVPRPRAVPLPLLLLGLLLALLAPVRSGALELHGRVVRVVDGDSITVLDAARREFKVRLAAIDAPERGQPFGQVSRSNLSDLVFGEMVTVEVDKVDRWGRLVGRVLRNGVDIGMEQLRTGLAWHFRRYADEQPPALREAYAAAEAAARAARVGLWRDAEPVPPWVWRRR
jgi:endonuclease YncB( thermonuclease family)